MITDRTNILELPVREAISYVFDDFRLDIKRQELQKNGQPVPLTHKAYQVLLILVQNSEQTVEKEYIYNQLWGDSFVEDANLTQHIYILRKTLGKNVSGESYIETVARTGYRFLADVRAVYPPVIAEPIFKGKNGADPALDSEPHQRIEPHLRLAEKRDIPEEVFDPVIVEQSEVPTAEPVGTRNNKKILLIILLVALVAAAVGLVVYYWPKASSTNVQPIRSVAVLPFKSIGEEGRNEKIGLGMADAIITSLSKLRQIPVRPTSSVVRYTDSPEPNSVAAGSELGVDTVLEGTVQLANQRVRVSVQLIDVSDGKPLWAENFDEPFTDIFEVQDSISKKVVRSVAASLTDKLQNSGGGTTNNIEAMKAFQMGLYLHSTRTRENLEKAEVYFREAIKHDDHFAKAFAMLADVYNMQRYYRFADPTETRAKGLDAATRALEIDASTPEAYIAMANLQVGGKEGMAGSKRLLEKAIELSPFNSTARLRYAWVIIFDDIAAAAEQMRLAQEYDPVSPISNGAYCNILIFQNNIKNAIPFCEKAFDINPTSGQAEVMLADAYFFDGRVDEAIRMIKQRIARTSGQSNLTAQGSLAFYLLRAGRSGEADPIVASLTALAEKEPELIPDLAILYFEKGNREKGLFYFKEAYQRRQLPVLMVDFYPAWDKVRTYPEVQSILKEQRNWPPSRPPSNSNLK